MRQFIYAPVNTRLCVCWAVLLPILIFCMSIYWVDLLLHFTRECNDTNLFRVENARTQSLTKNIAKTLACFCFISQFFQSFINGQNFSFFYLYLKDISHLLLLVELPFTLLFIEFQRQLCFLNLCCTYDDAWNSGVQPFWELSSHRSYGE